MMEHGGHHLDVADVTLIIDVDQNLPYLNVDGSGFSIASTAAAASESPDAMFEPSSR